ncbi:MAG: hypothetical protein FJ138_17800, partial [Deltaproteobacteria bacterium]|nr:hypothetical protein [Deltaproteobacteria bacterium]
MLMRQTLYIHQDALEPPSDLQRRAHFLTRQLLAGGDVHFKSTQGANRGWRRTKLGGNGGMQYYLWWAPRGSPPLAPLQELLPEHSVVIRAVRHHDETDVPLPLGGLSDYLRSEEPLEIDEDPWTPAQRRAISDLSPTQLLLGTPGTGKTTALWGCIEQGAWGRALYLTWSERLADSAREALAGGRAEVDARTTLRLFAELLGEEGRRRLPAALDAARDGVAERRWRELLVDHRRLRDHKLRERLAAQPALTYGIVRAWLLGRAPWEARRATQALVPRSGAGEPPPLSTRLRAWDTVVQPLLEDVRRAYEQIAPTEEERMGFAPELVLAKEALRRVREDMSPLPEWCAADLITLDEAQDLTPLELEVLVALAQRVSRERGAVHLRVAGDEGQALRPTYFSWREVQQQLYLSLSDVTRQTLDEHLRCPPGVVGVLERLSGRYELLPPELRPREQALTPAPHLLDEGGEPPALGLLTLSASEARAWLDERAEGREVCYIYLGEAPPAWAEGCERAGDYLRSPAQVKGLEYQLVALLGLSEALAALTPARAKEAPLEFVLTLNALRVGVSRSAAHLIALEVTPPSAEAYALFEWAEARSDAAAPATPAPATPAAAAAARTATPSRAPALTPERLRALGAPPRDADERVASLLSKAAIDRERAPAAAWRALALA